MKNGENLYGAVLSGNHVFYIIEGSKEPMLDGIAQFSHLWLKTESGWKMSRVLSYDHKPAPYVNKRKQVTLSKRTLKKFAGSYQLSKGEQCIVRPKDGTLVLTIGDKAFSVLPETETVFFMTNRDVTFEFKKGKMIVRERGNIVEESSRAN